MVQHTYRSTLPAVFRYRMTVSLDQLPGIVTMLSFPRTEAPNGSSFAVTSDAKDGYRHVWLSESSMLTIAAIDPGSSAYDSVEDIDVL